MTVTKKETTDDKINPQLHQESVKSEPRQEEAQTSSSSKENKTTSTDAASSATATGSRKLPPLASLQSVYRSDYQPFTTFLPYEPAFREQQSNGSSSVGAMTTNIAASALSRLESGDFGTAGRNNNNNNDNDEDDVKPASNETKLEKSHHSGVQAAHDRLKQQQQQQHPHKTKPSTTTSSTASLTTNDQQKPFKCTFESCEWSFARQSDLTRHFKSHMAPQYNCPYWKNDPTCHKNGGAFNRLDVLKRHLKLVHYVRDKRLPIGEGSSVEISNNGTNSRGSVIKSVDEPGWCRSCQRMFPNAKAFIEHCYECASQTQPTEWRSQKSTNVDSSGASGSGVGGSSTDADLHQTKFRVLIGPPQNKKQKTTAT